MAGEHERPQVYEDLIVSVASPPSFSTWVEKSSVSWATNCVGSSAYVAAGGVDVVWRRLRTDQESLCPVAFAGFHDHLGQALEDLGAGLLLRERVGRRVLKDRSLFQVVFDHGRHVGEDGLIVCDAHARSVDEANVAFQVGPL